MKRILYNAIKTPDGTVLWSKHRHDYVSHTDTITGEYYMTDGGTDYLRRNSNEIEAEDLTVYDDGTHETRRNNMHWGVNYTKDMKRLPETKWIKIKDLDTEHIKNIIIMKIDPFYLEVFNDELKYRTND